MKTFIYKKSNRLFLILYFILFIISNVAIFLAEFNNGQIPKLFIKQTIFFVISLFLIYLIQKISIFKYEKISIIFFILSITLLLGILIAPDNIAPTINGAKSWFNLGIFSFQPSELAKVSSVMFFSYLSVNENFKKSNDLLKIVSIAVIIFIPFILVLKENDLGNALFFIFLFLVLIFLVSSNKKILTKIYFISILVPFVIMLFALQFPRALLYFGLKEYQINRLLSWINPKEFVYSYSYQLTNALNEVSSGGISGTFQKNKVFISEQYNDFIITVIAKNFGFVGVTLFILLYLFFILIIIRLAKKCITGNFSYNISILTSFSFSFAFIINSYSSTGIIPVVGISMPFISYGGSSLLSNSILLGIIININNTIYEEQLYDEE